MSTHLSHCPRSLLHSPPPQLPPPPLPSHPRQHFHGLDSVTGSEPSTPGQKTIQKLKLLVERTTVVAAHVPTWLLWGSSLSLPPPPPLPAQFPPPTDLAGVDCLVLGACRGCCARAVYLLHASSCWLSPCPPCRGLQRYSCQ